MEILLAAIGRASLHGAVAIAAVWVVCRLFPRLPAALRCGLWWLACLKLLVALVWVEPIPLAVLPAAGLSAAGQEIKDSKDFKDSKDLSCSSLLSLWSLVVLQPSGEISTSTRCPSLRGVLPSSAILTSSTRVSEGRPGSCGLRRRGTTASGISSMRAGQDWPV
jgi:hypothetical protein